MTGDEPKIGRTGYNDIVMHAHARQMQYHRYLVALVLVLVGAVLGFLLLAVRQGHERAMRLGAIQALSTANILEERVRIALQSADFLIDDVAQHIDPQQGLPDPESAAGLALRKLMFEKWRRSPALANVAFLDANGTTRYTMLGNIGVSQRDEPYLTLLRTRPAIGSVFSDPHVLPQLHEPGVMLGRAIRDASGRPIAYAVGWLRSSYFMSLFQRMDLGPGGAISLADDHWHMLARYPQLSDFPVGRQFMPPKTTLGPLAQTYMLVSPLDQRLRISAWRVLPDYHFVVITGVAVEDALAEWQTQSMRYLAAALILCLFAAALVVMLITAAKQTLRLTESEARLRESNVQQRQLMELAPAAMAEVSGTPPKIIYANRDFQQLFACGPETGAPPPLSSLFADAADVTRLLQDSASNGGIHERELRLTDGRHAFWGLVSATALPGGGATHFLLGFADIDARKVLEHRLTVEASTDALTGLANRRYFFARAEAACEAARRYNRPLAVVVMDLDHFKSVNDTYGHRVGDAVLERAARILQVTLRQPDLPARIGGEEFVALLPETTLQQAGEAGERIRQAIEDAPLTLEDGRLVAVTASFGVSAYDGEASIQPAIDRADAAMYRAKEGGRNRVEVA